MAAKFVMSKINLPRKIRCFSLSYRKFNDGRVIYNKSVESGAQNIENVSGLSANVIIATNEPVGPGASKDSKNYKNPEYFCYHAMSYHEAEIEMLKYRCPQPSNKKSY